MQRFFDVVFSSIALISLLPLFLSLIFILRLTGEGEIFFLQNRVGLRGKNFKLYKFATMLKDSPNIGTGTVTVKDDRRVLPIGRFLRKTKINELPQLINILKGDMSVIGPRPQTQRCFDAFPSKMQNEIIKVRPGLSGIGSVVFRSEEEMMYEDVEPNQLYDDVIMPYKGKLESWYVNNQSVWNYFVIIILTILIIFTNSTRIVFYCFSSLPRPPKNLKSYIYSDFYV
tara:strand:- start:1118 stop:1801 length:684 start_codon:yes stop_codon:yes gene_type:complete